MTSTSRTMYRWFFFPMLVLSLTFTEQKISYCQNLEIHYINVGWGSSVFVKGPDGTTILLEAGDDGMGSGRVVTYLQRIGMPATSGLDYTIAGHQHLDHIGGLDE